MRRIRLPASLVLALALVAGACASGDTEQASGFQLSDDQVAPIEPTTTTEPEPDWEVEVATATVPVVEARCSRPTELDDEGPSDDPDGTDDEPEAELAAAETCVRADPPEGKPALSPIPGPQPNATSARTDEGWSFNNPTFFGNPLVFLVTENHGDWLKVMLPTRPNQQEGWIRADDVELSSHEWRAQINVTTNSLKVWNGDALVVDTGTIDGKATTPTPIGTFYFNEKIEKYPSSAYGSWIFSTNGYSDTLETFDGGLPVFAVHGTNVPQQIGSDISNGCVRVPNEAIELMAREVPMGTPVEVVA